VVSGLDIVSYEIRTWQKNALNQILITSNSLPKFQIDIPFHFVPTQTHSNMPTARRLLSMPLNQLILPSQDILDGLVPFMYSELTIPSRVHEVVIDNLLGELKTVVRVYNKRRIVTRRIIALLTPLAGRKPRRTHCNVHGHRFFKVLLVNGSTDHRTNNIGWWQLLVRFYQFILFDCDSQQRIYSVSMQIIRSSLINFP